MRSIGRWVVVGLLLAGCQSATGQRGAFPATWPGSQPLGAEASTVQVLPIEIVPPAVEGPAPTGEGLPTAAVLSALFVKHLHVNGVKAVLDLPEETAADYLLRCRVPALHYHMLEGYPARRTYRAEMTCDLLHPLSRRGLWSRKLHQQYEQTVVLDFFTKLPAPIHRDDRIMYQECIVPLWDAMAQSVGTVVRSREQWIPAGEPADADDDLQVGFRAR